MKRLLTRKRENRDVIRTVFGKTVENIPASWHNDKQGRAARFGPGGRFVLLLPTQAGILVTVNDFLRPPQSAGTLLSSNGGMV